MTPRPNMFKVLSPVEGKNGKTFWIRIGSAFINRDGSTNVYLNAYPTSGKLQIREIDERDHRDYASSSTSATEEHPARMLEQDELPF
jgi:hypothetical protein